MERGILQVANDMFSYLLSIEVSQLPYHIAMIGVSAMMSYIAALVVIGFPCSVWEAITKQKIKDEVEDRITRFATILITILLILLLLYDKVT